MIIRALLKRNTYFDSITLMSLGQVVKEQVEVDDIGIVMATEANRLLLYNAGLFPDALYNGQEIPPGAEDLLIVVRAEDEARARSALAVAEKVLTSPRQQESDGTAPALAVRSLEMALRHDARANLAVISVAGAHAWLEAEQALRHGLHVFLFSNNVSIEHEQRLKALAASKGLLLMGPDCGTASINGVGLGFCNKVPSGSIGIVGASGTGMQQLMCLISAAGLGISQAIGTGSRDLSDAIGGVMTRKGLELLVKDPQTQVIVLVSKTPAERIVRELLQTARDTKTVVGIFLGMDPGWFEPLPGNFRLAQTLTEGAELAVALAGEDPARVPGKRELLKYPSRLETERAALASSQRSIRALYSGGTLCYEAMRILGEQLGAVASNISLRPERALTVGEMFRGHTALDVGTDDFTQGRLHPMIDPSIRLQYMARAADDPETAVILLDIVLGLCAHPDPGSVYAPVIVRLRDEALAAGGSLPVIVSLCGTEGDPQRLSRQRAAFEAAGALVFESNVAAALAAASLVN